MRAAVGLAIALCIVAAGCASGEQRLGAVDEPAPEIAIVGSSLSTGVFSDCGPDSGVLCFEQHRPTDRIPSSATPVRVVARLRRSPTAGGDVELATYRTEVGAFCFAVVAGAPRCTNEPGCSELCADEWTDDAGRGVLAALAPWHAATVRVVLEDGATLTDRLDGPTLGPFANRRRIFMLDLGRRSYRRLEVLDAADHVVAVRVNPSSPSGRIRHSSTPVWISLG